MLVLNNINKSFKNIEVLKNISFTVKENKIFAFLGPNGVGKTTSLVEESIQEATWLSLAISIPSKNIRSHP